MNVWQRFMGWWRGEAADDAGEVDAHSLRRLHGEELPETGRSSVESNLPAHLRAANAFWGNVSPVISFEMLTQLKYYWVFNPDFSQYVQNIVNLTNTGHNLTVTASSKRRAAQAVARLNESASRIYRIGAGVDGLINAYLAQAAWSGAISSEDVVNFSARRIERVALVPVEQIRFLYIDDEFVPHQQPGVGAGLTRSPLGLIRLNPVTYRYLAVQTVENSPYAKPPATAAVAPIAGPQKDMLENIRFVAKKYGLLGLISISVEKPQPDVGETQQQYQARAQRYLAAVGKAAEGLSHKGLIVTYSDQKVEHDSITSDTRGAEEVWKISEGQVFSGMGTFPAFHGRPDSTTETYANVVYNFMLAQGHNFQRVVKRRHEGTGRLDLLLAGLDVAGLSMGFNREPARNPLQQAQADRINDGRAILKAEKGIISPNQAAQEMGYESAWDASLMAADKEAAKALQRLGRRDGFTHEDNTITLRFDRNSQSYKFLPDAYTVRADAAT